MDLVLVVKSFILKDKWLWFCGILYWWNEKNFRYLFLRKSNKIFWNKIIRLYVI